MRKWVIVDAIEVQNQKIQGFKDSYATSKRSLKDTYRMNDTYRLYFMKNLKAVVPPTALDRAGFDCITCSIRNAILASTLVLYECKSIYQVAT